MESASSSQSCTSADSVEKPTLVDTTTSLHAGNGPVSDAGVLTTDTEDSGQADRELTMEIDETPQTSTQPAGSKDAQLPLDNQACNVQDEDKDPEKRTLITLTVDESKKYHCSECQVWAQGHAFEEHLICHIILRPYQCLYCSQCFINRRDVTRHVMKIHTGKKMNCALKALKKARGLMKSALESGTHTFYACVAGKVPLASDLKAVSSVKKARPEGVGTGSSGEGGQHADSPATASEAADTSCTSAGSNSDMTEPGESGNAIRGNTCNGSHDDDKQDDVGSSSKGCEDFTETSQSDGQKTEAGDASAADVTYRGTEKPAQLDLSTNNTSDFAETESHLDSVAQINASQEADDSINDIDRTKVTAAQIGDRVRSMNETTHSASETTVADTATQDCASVFESGQPQSDEDEMKDLEAKCDSETEVVEAENNQSAADSDQKECETDHGESSPQPEGHTEMVETMGSGSNTSFGSPVEMMECEGAMPLNADDASADYCKDDKSVEDVDEAGPGQATGLDLQESGCNEEEDGVMELKIVAAFSLQDEETKEDNSQDLCKDSKEMSYGGSSSEPPELTPEVTVLNGEGKIDTPVLTLGPPSKPIPSSSFLDLPPPSQSITSVGYCSSVPEDSFNFFVCGFNCSFSSLTSLEFRDHLILDHAGESSFHCFHCGYQSVSEDGLIRHISAHAHTYSKSAPLYICGASACKFGSNLVADFVTHQSAWHPELTTFHCHDCDSRFESVNDLLKHFEANFLHTINCPHCTAKSTQRRRLLNHIASAHPGKPKMVSVAKQIVCRDRKLNNFITYVQQRSQAAVSSLPVDIASVGIESVPEGSNSRTSLMSILTQPIQPQEREITRQAAMTRNTVDMTSEVIDDDEDCFEESFDDSFDEEEYSPQSYARSEIAYMGSKADDREVDNFKCKFCTFIARDRCRLEGHERCHGLPPSRKSRFKCMYCPQGFNNDHKFNSHVSCHPGLMKFSLYCCKFCEFDSNQRHIIVKHVRSTRDQAHMNFGSSEDDLFTVVNKTMETRVLECRQCSYMTRHRKHLVAHLKRDHSSPRKTGITVDCDIVENYPGDSLTHSRNKGLELALTGDHASSHPVGDDANIRENQARRFKCPICQYLVPRAADLKAHVKRHSEIGEITLVMFRCKYCSAASTAREVIYGHLMEKHLGKQIALVKRIVTIDTRGSDNGYAVTSMEDEEDGQTSTPASGSADKMVLLIPDSAGEVFQSQMPCPCCSFSALSRQSIIQHVSDHHPEVKIMGRRQDNEVYQLVGASSSSSPAAASAARITYGDALTGEILIVPDSHAFDEAVLCPKCDFSTFNRRSIVQHLEKNHPEVSVMGRNDYPTIDSKGKEAQDANATGKDGMVIIGSGSLDEKIQCLYENFGDRMKCMICQGERPKKFFMHVHILRHLNILLWGCQYCSHKGLQKYKMMDHIKKVHPNRAFCIRYLPVNVEERVSQYLKNASMIRARRSGEEADCISPSKGSFSDGQQSVTSDNDLNTLRLKHKAAQDNLNSCTIGSEELDMKLACLYSLGNENRYHCVVCAQEFQRKFAVHRHIVHAHLKVNLIGCGYCELEGVERHIMMDHILETHKNTPIKMRNLAQNLENKVADFLSQMTLSADDAIDLSAADLAVDDSLNFKLPERPQLEVAFPPRTPSPCTPSSSPSTTPSASPSHGAGKNQLNPSLLLLGKDSLNKHLLCMFKMLPGPVLKFRCVVCRGVFDRKYAIHRHLLMKHLKKGIIGCPYCSFEGVERYQVFTHIKEDHKNAELRMQHLSVDMDTVVSEFMENLANGTLDLHNKTPPPWSMKKAPKREVYSDEESDAAPSTAAVPDLQPQGLVVAMFGGKSSSASFIKQEPVDEDDSLGREPVDRELDGGEDADGIDYEALMGISVEDGDREVSTMSLQAANGTKAKVATDVQTNIRVITVKEKGFKRHICEKCKFTSLHRSNIVRHIYRVHEQYREQECPACNYKTLSRVLIEQHMQSEHPDMPFPQSLSDRGLKRSLDTSQEDMEYDSMKKSKAAANSKRREGSMSLLSDGNNSSQLYACAYCDFETMTHSEIVQHTRDSHSLGEPMKAPDDLEQSVKVEQEEEGPEEAKEEEAEDTEFQSLVNTVKMNQVDLSGGVEDSLWQCFYCSYKTSSEEDLKIHFADSHPSNVYRSKKIPTWRFVCRSCHVKTRAHSKMRYHLNRHINYRPYTCTTCGSFYPSPDQCRKHCRANNHNETFTYVKIPRKEKRLQELLKECQEIAMALTRNPGEAGTSEPPTLSHPFPSKRKAKKSFPSASQVIPSKQRKNYEYDAPYPARKASSHRAEDQTKEGDVQMACSRCDFSAQNVCDVWLHFIEAHEGQDFLWVDSASGHLCTETGEITNAKVVPPDLEEPVGPGYSMRGSRLLNCHHCEFTTSTVQAMKSHLRRHMPKRYLCPYCSLRCSRSDTITQHVRCGHKGKELWTIFFQLPEGFVPEGDAGHSESEHMDVDVEEPQVTFQTEAVREDSSSSSSPAGADPAVMERIGCGQCELKLDSVAAIHEHHDQDHPQLDFLWVDSSNGYTFNQSGEVIDAREQSPQLFTQDGFTVESDNGNVPTFCCKFCHFTSAFIQAIKSHMKSHLPHGFMCPYCCMATNSKEKMLSHQSCVHRGQEPWVLHLRMSSEGNSSSFGAGAGPGPASGEKNVPTLQRQSRDRTSYSCSVCEYSSFSLYQYRLHLANHSSAARVANDDRSEDLPLQSNDCSEDLSLQNDSLCEGDFGADISSHTEELARFGCVACDFTAGEQSDVQSHMRLTHSHTDLTTVIDLQAETVSEQDGTSTAELQLIDLDPKVKVVPVNDLDLDREGLTLFSPPPSPETYVARGEEDGEMEVGGGEMVTEYGGDQVDGQSDSADDTGTCPMTEDREMEVGAGGEMEVGAGGEMEVGAGEMEVTELVMEDGGEQVDSQSDSTDDTGTCPQDAETCPQGSPALVTAPPAGGILKLTVRGNLSGEYGIKRVISADSVQ